jgi:hypothetical protein
MIKIGFIDYYLDEWHANNYPGWIRENSRLIGRSFEVAYAWADIVVNGVMDTGAWCDKYGVMQLSSIEELVEKSDCIFVLSPDNTEHHERLSRVPLMSGKPVYIDKTFSPDLASGVRMFDLARRHCTPVFSSSALRFASEFSNEIKCESFRKELDYVAVTGPGLYENYSVHQIEMMTTVIGTGASRIKSLSSASGRHFTVEYENGVLASILQIQQAPFQMLIQLKDGKGIFIEQCSGIFTRMIDAILNFFETGIPPVPEKETLEIMAIREAGYKALHHYDSWLMIERV